VPFEFFMGLNGKFGDHEKTFISYVIEKYDNYVLYDFLKPL
jgi:hypothetical protein